MENENLIQMAKWLNEEFIPTEKRNKEEAYNLTLTDRKIVLTKTGGSNWLIGSFSLYKLWVKTSELCLSYLVLAASDRTIEIEIS